MSKRIAFVLIAASAINSACAPTGTGWTESQSPKTIEVEVVSDSYVVKLGRDARSIRPDERQELAMFLSTLGDLETVEFSLRRTRRGLEVSALDSVQRELVAMGANPKRIFPLAEIGFDYEGQWADVEIIAKRHVAVAPACPDWSRNNLNDNLNMGSSNFGCATASALALSLSDPKDLVSGREIDNASGVHTAASVERYNNDQVKELLDSSAQSVSQD